MKALNWYRRAAPRNPTPVLLSASLSHLRANAKWENLFVSSSGGRGVASIGIPDIGIRDRDTSRNGGWAGSPVIRTAATLRRRHNERRAATASPTRWPSAGPSYGDRRRVRDGCPPQKPRAMGTNQ